jgi:aspartate/methionine/tyrosine aminotransferase
MLDNLLLIKQSYSVAFADFVRAQEAAGKKIIKMQTGDPDFATHDKVVTEAIKNLTSGNTKYCDSRGLMPLRLALAQKLAKENNIHVSAEENILITHGAIHGVNIAIKALINVGDECVILEPYWRAYEANVIVAGGIPIILSTLDNLFQLDADQILDRLTPATKLIIINTPNNPSGAIYDKNELLKLAKGAAAKGIYILSDEVYETITFNGKEHYSMASDISVFDYVISAYSFSKTHAMTGWRMGYIVASKTLIDEFLKLSQFSITSIAPFSQMAALAALSNTEVQLYSESMRAEYESRKNHIIETIKGTWLEGAITVPEGTFYTLIDISAFNLTSMVIAKKLVEVAGVSFTPGIAFGDNMDNFLRMCFATSTENIQHAINALLNLNISK